MQGGIKNSMAKTRKHSRLVRSVPKSDPGERGDPGSTSRLLLKLGLASLALFGASIFYLVRSLHMNPPDDSVRWLGLAAITFLFAAPVCLLFSLAFWADKKWRVLSRWVWPRRAS